MTGVEPGGGMTEGSAAMHTVLCVDDELVGLSVRRLLLERQGYKVLTAQGGLEAIAVFQQHAVDLVILDYSMPGMNGGDVALELRRHKPEIPIVLLSAYVNPPDEVVSRVDHYLVKGDGPPVLLEKIAGLLHGRTGGRTA